MLKITLGDDGMMCGMCESHVHDAVRKDLDEQAVRDAVNATGYTVTSFSKEPYEKKGLFSFLHK